MEQYLGLMETIIQEGDLRPTRTGINAFSVSFPPPLSFDCSPRNLPIVSTKRVALKPLIGELIGFIRGYTSAAQFRELGCGIWDANANDPGLPEAPNSWLGNPNRKGTDDLGRIYGAQWRGWETMSIRPTDSLARRGEVAIGTMLSGPMSAAKHEHVFVRKVDQLERLVRGLKEDPFSRYHLVSAWNPGEIDQMALPPCHYAFQCYVRRHFDTPDSRILDMQVHMRSVDVFLGLPFNITSYAILLHMLANVTGYEPGRLVITLGDAHIYENHLPQVLTQLRRTPRSAMPTITIGSRDEEHPHLPGIAAKFTTLDAIHPSNILISGYNPHDALPAKMAV